MKTWISDSLERILPDTRPSKKAELEISGAPGAVIAFQMGVQADQPVYQFSTKLTGNFAKHATVRLGRLVPILRQTTDTPAELLEGRAPCFTPDPLVPTEGEKLEPGVSRTLWVTLRLPRKSGTGRVAVDLIINGKAVGRVTAKVAVWPFSLPKFRLPVTFWFYSDAIMDWYNVEPFDKRYWALVEKYFRNLADHHQTAIYTPLFTPPLDSEKRDVQLVDVTETSPGRYRFGFSKVKRWIQLAKKSGLRYFEMSHLFTQWGCRHAIRILAKKADGTFGPLWGRTTPATGAKSRAFLEQFLPALVRFLKSQGVYNKTFFHLSDEPNHQHLAQYAAVREMVRQIVPDIEILEALSNYEFHEHGLVDMPVPSLHHLDPFRENNVPCWTYTCCHPKGRFSNRFLDYPLFRLRVLGMMLYQFDSKGFLHWGCNYWYKGGTTQMIDPYRVTDSKRWPAWAAGDAFILYPGDPATPGRNDGPIDSIRWETYREAFDDHRLMTALAKKVGDERVAELLKDIKAGDDYPQSAAFIRKVRAAAVKLMIE